MKLSCECLRAQTNIPTHKPTYVRTCMHVCMYACMHLLPHAASRVRLVPPSHSFMHACICTYISACMACMACIQTYIHTCIQAYITFHLSIHASRQTDRHLTLTLTLCVVCATVIIARQLRDYVTMGINKHVENN